MPLKPVKPLTPGAEWPGDAQKHLYEYAVVRYVPDVEREEFVNIGLVMMCKRRRWLKVAFDLPQDAIYALWPKTQIENLLRQIASFETIAQGGNGPISSLETHERFRWLTAVRSAAIQTSRPHPGLTTDLEATFCALKKAYLER